jgi:hypothetical protein
MADGFFLRRQIQSTSLSNYVKDIGYQGGLTLFFKEAIEFLPI